MVNYAGLVPQGATPAARRAQADVFYVHPTTYRDTAHWNADVADGATNHWTDISVIARQASAFNGCCRVFAPRYRQASLAAFASPADGAKAYDLAFADVKRAFDYYLAHDNHGRPFILAGHSQGALMVRRLLAERVRGTVYARRMVAAYVIGIGLIEGPDAPALGDDLRGFSACTTSEDSGCVLSWNSWLAGSDAAGPAAYRQRALAGWQAAHAGAAGRVLCDNPLLWGTAGADGALPGEPLEAGLQPLVRSAVEAQCVDGLLMARPLGALGLNPLPGGNMHYHDISLYYADVRVDALRRVRRWVADHAASVAR